MMFLNTEEQDVLSASNTAWHDFAKAEVAPLAERIDRDGHIPASLVQKLRAQGAFAHGFAEQFGGPEGSAKAPLLAAQIQGGMHEALGYASAAVQGLVNVHHMGGSALARWGSKAQKSHWVPKMTSSEVIAAIAITEPNVGSQTSAVETWATQVPDGYKISGTKAWITCGQSADIFVLITGSDQGPVAFILPKNADGLQIEPIPDMLGCRGYMMAKLHLNDCFLPDENILGRPGFGASHVATTGLDSGRYNLAWGCVGLAQGCLDASLSYAKTREQFDAPIASYQLVQQKIAHMMTEIHASRLMCQNAGLKRAQKHPSAVLEATMAKYFASKTANRAAFDAVQIHGANGCGPDYPIERYYRDARIMEIIEGTSEILETLIARLGYQDHTA